MCRFRRLQITHQKEEKKNIIHNEADFLSASPAQLYMKYSMWRRSEGEGGRRREAEHLTQEKNLFCLKSSRSMATAGRARTAALYLSAFGLQASISSSVISSKSSRVPRPWCLQNLLCVLPTIASATYQFITLTPTDTKSITWLIFFALHLFFLCSLNMSPRFRGDVSNKFFDYNYKQ